MPSESILKEKKKIVEEMTGRLKSQAGVFVDYKGITVNEDTELRVKMREANVDYSVIRNRLMKFAIKNVGFDELENILVGTTALATCDEDPIAPARIVKEYADKLTNYFEIKAGFMDGKVLSVDEVNSIASIPALPVLQAQFLGTLLAPITSLAIVIKEIAEKGGIPADAEVEAPSTEAAPEKPAKEEPIKEAVEASPEKPAKEEPAKEAAEAPPEKPAKEEPAKEAAEASPEKPKAPAKKPAAKKPVEAESAAEATEEKPKKAPAKKPAAKKPAKEETPVE